jgi:hypothetical protein
MHKKRGYFFTLDASLALFVLIIGIFIIATFSITSPKTTQLDFLSIDLLNFLSNTKILELNDDYAGIGGQLWDQGLITDKDNNLLQQIGEFYYLNNTDTADLFAKQVTDIVVPPQYRYEIYINNAIVYPKVQTGEHNHSKNNATLMLTSKKITFGLINNTQGELWGPYLAEVFVWQ